MHPTMKQTPNDLEQITATTLGHYNSVAEDFREGTRDHDVSQNINALLRHIQVSAPFTILDFGCGPGPGFANVYTNGSHRGRPRRFAGICANGP
jgi:hypothetical protein